MSTVIIDQVLLAQGVLQLQRTSSSSVCDATFSQKDERSVLWLRISTCFLNVWKHGPVVRVARASGTYWSVHVLFVAVHQ